MDIDICWLRSTYLRREDGRYRWKPSPVTTPPGFFDLTHEKLFSGQFPNRIIIRVVRNDAFSGSKHHSPYNFEHYNLSEISVFADGHDVQNIKPLIMNFATWAIRSIIQYPVHRNQTAVLWWGTGDRSCGLSERIRAVCLWPQSRSYNDEKFELFLTGSVRLQLKFSHQLPHPITLIIYAKYQNLIEIDHNWSVIYDFMSWDDGQSADRSRHQSTRASVRRRLQLWQPTATTRSETAQCQHRSSR